MKYWGIRPLEEVTVWIAVDNTDKATYNIVMKILYLYKFNIDNITVLEEDIFNLLKIDYVLPENRTALVKFD